MERHHLYHLLLLLLFMLCSSALIVQTSASTPSKGNPLDTGGLSRKTFPKGFIFWTATSAYQVEGMTDKGGRGYGPPSTPGPEAFASPASYEVRAWLEPPHHGLGPPFRACYKSRAIFLTFSSVLESPIPIFPKPASSLPCISRGRGSNPDPVSWRTRRKKRRRKESVPFWDMIERIGI